MSFQLRMKTLGDQEGSSLLQKPYYKGKVKYVIIHAETEIEIHIYIKSVSLHSVSDSYKSKLVVHCLLQMEWKEDRSCYRYRLFVILFQTDDRRYISDLYEQNQIQVNIIYLFMNFRLGLSVK